MKRKGLIALLAAVLVTMSMAFVSADESDFKLVNSYPKDGQTNTSIENVGVKLRFNRELAGEKAQKNNAKCVKIVDPNGKEIPIKVMSSKEDKGLLLVLGDSNNKKFKVENNAKYKLVISENLTDDQGDRLGKETTLSFTTFNQRLNMMINMGMMFLIFGGITVMTIRNANQQQEKKNKKDEKEEAAFNPYHEAKRTGKTVEEVIAENKKKEEKAAKKAKRKNKDGEAEYVKDYQLKLSEILPNVYSVSAPRPISAAGGKYISSHGPTAKAAKAAKKSGNRNQR